MIIRVITEGPAGSDLKPGNPDKFDVNGAKMVLVDALEQGFEVINSMSDKLVVSKYSGDEGDEFRYAEYQTFSGPIGQMKELLAIARAAKLAAVPA